MSEGVETVTPLEGTVRFSLYNVITEQSVPLCRSGSVANLNGNFSTCREFRILSGKSKYGNE